MVMWKIGPRIHVFRPCQASSLKHRQQCAAAMQSCQRCRQAQRPVYEHDMFGFLSNGNVVEADMVVRGGHLGHSAAQARPKRHHNNDVRVIRPLLRSFSRLTQVSSKAAHLGNHSKHRRVSDTAVAAAAHSSTHPATVQTARAPPRAGPTRAGTRKVPAAAPPTECGHGVIAYIKCWLNEDGYVAGVAFEGKGGGKGPELCHTRGTYETHFLHEGETITEIISCKGPRGGISHMEFHTDGGRIHPITCGQGSQTSKDQQPEEQHDEQPGRGRNLLNQVPVLKHARVLHQLSATSSKQGQSGQQQRQQQQHMRTGRLFEDDPGNDEEREIIDYQAYHMDSEDSTAGDADREGRNAGHSESRDNSTSGPAADHDRHDSDASGDQEWCESLTQGQMPAGTYEISDTGPRKSNKVQYDVKEMYPVGGLTASCSAQGHIMDIHNTCWDAKDHQPSVAGPVLVEAYVQLNDGPSELVRDPVQQEECDAKLCDNVDNSRQLSAWAGTALPHILEDVGGRDVWVKHSVLSCKPCDETSGTMLQVALALYAQASSIPDIEHSLKSLMSAREKNICVAKGIRIGCPLTGVGMFKLANVWVKTSKQRQGSSLARSQ